MEQTHLGDGMYISYDGYNAVIRTNSGYPASVSISLTPKVWRALALAIERIEDLDKLRAVTAPAGKVSKFDGPEEDPDDVRFVVEPSDQDEYRAAHAARQARDARAMRKER